MPKKIINLQDQPNKLNEKVDNQEKRIYFLEKLSRQRNVVFFGMIEKVLSYDNLQNNINNFIKITSVLT